MIMYGTRSASSARASRSSRSSNTAERPRELDVDLDPVQRIARGQHAERASLSVERLEDTEVLEVRSQRLRPLLLLEGLERFGAAAEPFAQ